MARLWLYIARGAVGQRGHAGDRRRPRRLDRRKGIAQPPARKGGVNNAALLFPQIAVGQEHRVPQQGPQPCADAVRFGEIIGAFVQHQPDQLWIIHHIAAEKRGAKLCHPRAVQLGGLRRQNICAEQFEVAKQRHLIRPRRRLGRNHGAISVYFDAGTSMREAEGARPL